MTLFAPGLSRSFFSRLSFSSFFSCLSFVSFFSFFSCFSFFSVLSCFFCVLSDFVLRTSYFVLSF